jgi:hypothetical protein
MFCAANRIDFDRIVVSVALACFATLFPTRSRLFSNSTPPPSVLPVACFFGPDVNPVPLDGLAADDADIAPLARDFPIARSLARVRDRVERVSE